MVALRRASEKLIEIYQLRQANSNQLDYESQKVRLIDIPMVLPWAACRYNYSVRNVLLLIKTFQTQQENFELLKFNTDSYKNKTTFNHFKS